MCNKTVDRHSAQLSITSLAINSSLVSIDAKMNRFSLFSAKLLFLSILLQLTPNDVHSYGLLSLLQTSSIASINSVELCDSLVGLNKKQKHICRKNIEVMDSVRKGANNAINECEHQFQERRWNCTSTHKKRIFGKLLNEGTRESAFIHAISSAGIAYEVTKYCSNGQLTKCGCDRTIAMTPAHGFQWAGCSDNIAFGIAFAKTFVDSRDLKAARSQKTDLNSYVRARALMNLHNNEAGRKVINNNMKIECKCHGVSGSCELKTCWRSMPSFRQIGNILKEKFDSATEVQLKVPTQTLTKPGPKMEAASMTSEGHLFKSGQLRPYLTPINHFKPQTETDLIYLHSSPDFCERNEKIGSMGTHGRQCNRTSKAIDGCELMCCGRGYKTRIEKVEDRCNCKFHWCCYVQCEKCWKEVEINTCL